METTTVAAKVDRWFLKCADCLSVVVTEVQREVARTLTPSAPLRPWKNPKPECGACGGLLLTMGRVLVGGSRFVTGTVDVCPCDERCTNAPGPKCECSCGAKFHG